jgi:serine/threonine protein kinase
MKLSDDRKRFVVVQRVLHGIHWLHAHRIYHGDIAPRNIILLPDGKIKFIDFGHAAHHWVPNPRVLDERRAYTDIIGFYDCLRLLYPHRSTAPLLVIRLYNHLANYGNKTTTNELIGILGIVTHTQFQDGLPHHLMNQPNINVEFPMPRRVWNQDSVLQGTQALLVSSTFTKPSTLKQAEQQSR